jgi:hypothetical protein
MVDGSGAGREEVDPPVEELVRPVEDRAGAVLRAVFERRVPTPATGGAPGVLPRLFDEEFVRPGGAGALVEELALLAPLGSGARLAVAGLAFFVADEPPSDLLSRSRISLARLMGSFSFKALVKSSSRCFIRSRNSVFCLLSFGLETRLYCRFIALRVEEPRRPRLDSKSPSSSLFKY